jgi:signal transduction histidine kinase
MRRALAAVRDDEPLSPRPSSALRALDWFIPAPLREDDELRLRSRLLVGISFKVPVFAVPLMCWALVTSGSAHATVLTLGVGAAAVVANPFALRRWGDHSLPGVLMCAELVVGLTILAYYNAGLQSASLLWMLPVPLVAHLVVGPRFGVAIGAACALIVASFYAVSSNGFEFPQTLSDQQMEWWRMAGLATAVSFIALLGWLYEVARRDAQEALWTSVAVVANKTRALQRTSEALARSHRQLQEAQVELIERERLASVGQVAAGVAHELRNPLNGIKMIAQGALRDARLGNQVVEELGEDLREVVSLADSASSIIEDIRVSTDQAQPRLQPTDVQSELRRALRLLQRAFQQHDIEIIERIGDLPSAVAEPGRLQQVLLNLLQNAVDALANQTASRADRSIEVVAQLCPGRGHVELRIQDNAGGIPADVQRRIFEPFFTTKPPGRGTGLGLSISRRLTEQCGGRITCDVRQGEGSTFTVTLPVWQGDNAAARGGR